jgi:hypothetical protein
MAENCWDPAGPSYGQWGKKACTSGRWAPLDDHSSVACEAIACNVIACWPFDAWERIYTPQCAPPAEGGGIIPPEPMALGGFSRGFTYGFY